MIKDLSALSQYCAKGSNKFSALHTVYKANILSDFDDIRYLKKHLTNTRFVYSYEHDECIFMLNPNMTMKI